MAEIVEKVILNIGELQVVNFPAILACFGIGSCVCVFLHHRQTKISGGAHIMLAGKSDHSLNEKPGIRTEMAFLKMLGLFGNYGIEGNQLRAHIVGGSQVLGNTTNNSKIGSENITSVKHLIERNKIFLAGEHIGGFKSRTAKFYTTTGELKISSNGKTIII